MSMASPIPSHVGAAAAKLQAIAASGLLLSRGAVNILLITASSLVRAVRACRTDGVWYQNGEEVSVLRSQAD